MATQVQPTEWIDRYLAEVAASLPSGRRADVEAEIRTLIEDELAARSVADEDAVLEILSGFGEPSQVAMRYGATQYLIGPALYPIFVKVLRVVLAVSLGLTFFAAAVSIGVGGNPWSPLETLSSVVMGLLQSAAIVLLVFAIIERLRRGESADRAKPWDPRSLSAVRDEDRVNTGEMVASIAFTIVALLVFNFYLGEIGRYWTSTTGWQSFPIFSPQFSAFVPWLSAWWMGTLILSIIVLARGRWNTTTRLVEIALNLFGLAVLLQMLLDGPLAAWPPLEVAFKLVVGIIFTFTAVETVLTAYRLVSGRRGSAPTAPTTTAVY